MGLLARALHVKFQMAVVKRSSHPSDWSDAAASGSSDSGRPFSMIYGLGVPPIPDAHLYLPQPRNPRNPLIYSPWYGEEDFERAFKSVKHFPGTSRDRCHLLRSFLGHVIQLDGAVAECGVWKGKTAFLLADVMSEAKRGKTLHLFDTFEGIPEPDATRDLIPEGTFADTSLEGVKQLLQRFEFLQFHKGLLPDTLLSCGGENFCFVHVDVDYYKPILECCRFFYPRLVRGGILLFDDYGFPSAPGAREAVDEFFRDGTQFPIYLPTGQCVVIKT